MLYECQVPNFIPLRRSSIFYFIIRHKLTHMAINISLLGSLEIGKHSFRLLWQAGACHPKSYQSINHKNHSSDNFFIPLRRSSIFYFIIRHKLTHMAINISLLRSLGNCEANCLGVIG
jgi:hypothetical protein